MSLLVWWHIFVHLTVVKGYLNWYWSNKKDDTVGTLISDYAERQFDTRRSKNTYIHTYIHAHIHTHIKLSCVFTHMLGTYSKNVLRWFLVFFDNEHSLSMQF